MLMITQSGTLITLISYSRCYCKVLIFTHKNKAPLRESSTQSLHVMENEEGEPQRFKKGVGYDFKKHIIITSSPHWNFCCCHLVQHLQSVEVFQKALKNVLLANFMLSCRFCFCYSKRKYSNPPWNILSQLLAWLPYISGQHMYQCTTKAICFILTFLCFPPPPRNRGCPANICKIMITN